MKEDLYWITFLYTIGNTIILEYKKKGLDTGDINPLFYGYWIMTNVVNKMKDI